MGELYRLIFPNGKAYIGISIHGAHPRFLYHSKRAANSDILLYRAWRKYGEPMLKILAVIENALLQEIEIKAIVAYGTLTPGGYNRTAGGCGTLGLSHSAETRAKISEANRNRSPEVRERMYAPNRGRVNSQETLAKMRIAHSNRSPEHRAKLSAAQKGIPRPYVVESNRRRTYGPHTPETKAKMSTARKLYLEKSKQ